MSKSNEKPPNKKLNSSEKDQTNYTEKKRFFSKMLTIYGRKPVFEALSTPTLSPYRLHLALSNKAGGIVDDIQNIAKQRGIELIFHDKQSLSRISRNGNQDQGVALDVLCPGFNHWETLIHDTPSSQEKANSHILNKFAKNQHLLAVDGVTNPQNLGLMIRSVSASPLTGILLPSKGCAKLDSLVIKASAGTLFRANIFHCETLEEPLKTLQKFGFKVLLIDAGGKHQLGSYSAPEKVIYVVGNESEGISAAIRKIADDSLAIPMQNGVESLNVSIAASLVAFQGIFQHSL